jgi:hypothetical protein
MRHRAPRPFVDLWHRAIRATAHGLGKAAERLPIRAVGILTAALALGIGGYAAIASVMDESPTRAIDPAGPTTASDAEGPLTSQLPEAENRGPGASTPESSTSAPARPKAPSSPSEEPPSPSTEPDPETGSPSTHPAAPNTAPTTPSTSPSQASPSTKKPEDVTPPNTSLSEEYPESDSAVFSFSANERAAFTCSLDGAAYKACDSPTTYTDLEPGWHTFAVRATDTAGNVDPSPAETRWHANNGDPSDDG